MDLVCSNCGTKKNSEGKLFSSKRALEDHEKECALTTSGEFEGDMAFELAEMIGGDLPDGAFWALYGEFRGDYD